MILLPLIALAAAGPMAWTPSPAPRGADSSIFAPLTAPPAPSPTRGANGAPGPKYWQNSASYDLKATLDTVTGTLHGTMTLRYTNNSPDALPFIWFQTEQNRFRGQAGAAKGDATLAAKYGDIIEQFTQRVGGKDVPLTLDEHRTETKVTLATPLKPGETATFHVVWHLIVPFNGDRMSRSGSLYQIAQWYPRVNVYDDVKGWNIEPYLGTGEFFLEYGDYTLDVTLPSNFIVAATGTLDNPKDVLTATEIARLAQAAKSDTTIPIVTAAELSDGSAHVKHDGMVTWKFHAKNVRDAVWAASPNYQWDASSWDGILAQAYYPPSAASVWHEVADMARMSIMEYSTRWFRYPYPQVSVAEGPVGGGMEYPMISFDGVFPTVSEYFVVTHEVGHEWFPMVVGSNERMHGWMDEGINSFITTFSNARRYPSGGDQTARGTRDLAKVSRRVIAHQDIVMEVPADQSADNQYTAYDKPSGVLQLLRRDVMGPALFDKGLQEYGARWAYKHPTPEDFFRTMNDVAGRDLSWFWREWFYETPSFDQAIDSVAEATSGGETHLTVTYGNHARGVLPLLVHMTFADGTTHDTTYRADVWRADSSAYKVSYTFPKRVTKIELDPDHHLVDVDRANGVWTAAVDSTTAH